MKYKMKSVIAACGILALAVSLFGQKAKSKKEIEAINAVNAATTVDARIQAIDNVLTNFADTEFKPVLLQMALDLVVQKGDLAQITTWAQRVLDADPKNADALVTLAAETARRTREFDLDKDEKLAKVEKWAKDGIESAKTMPKPQATMTDQQLETMRKDFEAQGYVALGMSDSVKKKYDDAIGNYKQATAIAVTPDPTAWVRLGQAYEDAHKWDEASDAFDKAANLPNASAQVKTIAQNKKAEVAKLKAAPPPAHGQ
jgi:tetratricopeptide (TPR) repeat protein